MEQKGILLSALGVGMGVGVGLGLASGQTMSKWAGNEGLANGITPDRVEQEMLRQIVDGRDSKVTFDQFPYYLNEQTRVLLTSAAYVHLKRAEVSKYTRNLSPASRAILLSGPAENYQQLLAKALAHYFQAKLLLLDVTDFSLKIQSKYGTGNKASAFKRSTSEMTLDRLSGLFGSFSIFPQKEEPKGTLRRQSSGVDLGSRGLEGSKSAPKLRRNASAAANISNLASQGSPSNPAPLKRTSSWSFDERLFVQSLYKVLVYVSKTTPIVLYLRDVDSLFSRSQRIYNLFQKMLDKLSGAVLILGSRIVDLDNDYRDVDERLTALFPYNIEIRPPDNESHLVSWKTQLEEDMKMIQVQDNKNHIMEVLSANDLDCDDLGSICIADTMDLSHYIEEIVVSAVSYHLMNNRDPEYRNGKLVISSKSLSHGLSIFQEGKFSGKDTIKLEAQAEFSKEAGKEGTTGVNLETKADSSAPENISGAEIVASVVKSESVTTKTEPAPVKTDADNPVPAFKAPEVPDNEFEKRIRPEVIPANEENQKQSKASMLVMAFKKTLAERLFNISKISTQTLRNCRISSSAVHLRPSAKPRESSEPGDNNAVFRRFLHERASVAKIWSVPVGENLMEKVRSAAISRSRIRLDGLAPPVTERMSAPAVMAGLTAEETRKLLRAAQMEAVKAKLREVEKTWVTYSEFVRICTEVCSDPDQGLGFAKSLDESGAVIVLGKDVCVKPEQVAKAIRDLIPIPGATPSDAKMKELQDMEKQKSIIDQKADALVRRELWLGLGYLVVQTAGFMRLTFWELSWDVMEPICFYVTSMYFMACYAFFLRTSKEPSFEGFFQSRFVAKQKKLMKDHNFDLGRYEELRKACYSLSSSPSDPSAAFDGAKRMPMQFGSNVL